MEELRFCERALEWGSSALVQTSIDLAPCHGSAFPALALLSPGFSPLRSKKVTGGQKPQVFILPDEQFQQKESFSFLRVAAEI